MHTRFSLLQKDTKERKMEITKLLFVIFACFIYGAASISSQSALVRTKRWKDGADMGTGDLSNMFRGVAGVDYPDLKTIPNTSFRCEEQVYEGGLYADVETRCQVYHVCHDGRKDSFMCGRGTIFNQQILACDYWYSADCDSAPNYYYVNSQIGDSNSPNNLQNNYSQNNGYNPHISGSNQGLPNTGGNVHQYDRNNQQPCQCLKKSNKTPWSFPSGMMHGSDK